MVLLGTLKYVFVNILAMSFLIDVLDVASAKMSAPLNIRIIGI